MRSLSTVSGAGAGTGESEKREAEDNKNSFPLIPKEGLILLVIADPVT